MSATGQAAQREIPPDWDRKAVCASYLQALRKQAETGHLDPAWIDQLMTALVTELRSAYTPDDVERAVANLKPLLEAWEDYATKVAQLRSQVPAVGETLPEDLQQSIARTRRTALGLRAALARLGNFIAEKERERRQHAAEGRARAELLARRKAEPPEPFDRDEEEASSGQPEENAPARLRIDGKALHGSLIPTWLGLVVLSWVSLAWGTLISIPFGVGIALAASFMIGIVAVPLWGTLFGFLGLQAAKNSTMRGMGYKPCGPYDDLLARTQILAKQLNLPPVQVGTVEVCNAFAMGMSRSTATVAIGRPLLTMLSGPERDSIIGHELGHIASGDMARTMLMRTFQNAGVWYMGFQGAKQFVRWIICWAAELFILAHSRHREYWADAVGAALAGKDAAISALRKVHAAPSLTHRERTHARFMFRGTFSTHPTLDQRIEALRNETYLRRLPLMRD